MEQILTTPLGHGGTAQATVSDYTTYVDSESIPLAYPGIDESYRANATITAGQVVRFVAATTTVPLSVTPIELDATVVQTQSIVGVALEGASAGDLVKVRVRGVCLVNIATTAAISSNVAGTAATPAAGVLAVTAGAGTSNAAGDSHGLTPSTSTIVGAAFGVYLGGEVGTSNKAPVYVGKTF